jgi:hypothetical protein
MAASPPLAPVLVQLAAAIARGRNIATARPTAKGKELAMGTSPAACVPDAHFAWRAAIGIQIVPHRATP